MSKTLVLEAQVDHEPSVTVVTPTPVVSHPPPEDPAFRKLLRDAIILLEHAAQAGIEVPADIAQPIIAAHQRGHAAWTDPSANTLFTDISKLGALLHPVTAETLGASRQQAHAAISTYKWTAIILAAFIVPWSILSFIFAGINTSIVNDIAVANQLVVSLHGQLEASAAAPAAEPSFDATPQFVPVNALSDLLQFAATIRSVYRHAQELSWFVPMLEKDPVTRGTRLELDPDLTPRIGKMRANLNELTASYQQIRSFAKYTQDDGAAAYGAVTTCILPIFYALLGACAYLLRSFSSQLAANVFAPSYSTVARFVIAAIAGGVIGLFNNFGAGQTANLSPLAISFLAGYSADVFFALIDGAVHSVAAPKKA